MSKLGGMRRGGHLSKSARKGSGIIGGLIILFVAVGSSICWSRCSDPQREAQLVSLLRGTSGGRPQAAISAPPPPGSGSDGQNAPGVRSWAVRNSWSERLEGVASTEGLEARPIDRRRPLFAQLVLPLAIAPVVIPAIVRGRLSVPPRRAGRLALCICRSCALGAENFDLEERQGTVGKGPSASSPF